MSASATEPGEVTRLLSSVTDGDRQAGDRLLELIYAQLRGIAGKQMAAERPGHTLGATALAHEAYLKLVGQEQTDWRSRAHFMAVAALAMRRILINHARAKLADKRGAGQAVATFDEQAFGAAVAADDLVRLDDALATLTKRSPRQAQVVTYKFFVGLGYDEIAEVMGISVPTVRRDWRFARAWLLRELDPSDPSDPSDDPDGR